MGIGFSEFRQRTVGHDDRLGDYIHVVEYHLQRMTRSVVEAQSIMQPAFPMLGSPEDQRYLIGAESVVGQESNSLRVYPRFDIAEVCMTADDAIIAAASVLDTSLQLTNEALNLGIEKRDVQWLPSGRKPKAVRTELAKRKKAAELLEFLDKVFGVRVGNRLTTRSAGYELFNGYRNWVVHRGAPIVEQDSEDGAFILTDEDLVSWRSWSYQENYADDEDARIHQQMDRYRFFVDCSTKVSENVYVWCYPVVPPVQAHYSAFIDKAPEGGLTLPGGIYIGEGSTNITIRNATTSAGSLIDPLTLYQEINPIDFAAEERAVRAGETLVKYRLDHYLNGIRSVRSFIEQVISQWDRHLAELSGGI